MLEIVNHASGASRTHALAKGTISVGRDAANDIVIDEPFISERHFQLTLHGKRWELIHPHPLASATESGLLFEGRQIQGDEAFRRPLNRQEISSASAVKTARW